MMDKPQLIDNIIGLQEKLSRLSLGCRMDNWMKLDLTIDQLKSLILIQYRGKITFKELAEALGMTRANITGIADRLIQNGLVTRRQNPSDRRFQYLMLTKKGRGILDNIKQMIVTEQTRVLSGLNMEDLAAMEKGLSAFVKSAESYFLSEQNKARP
jgi:MarR family transcriptional regulator, organic hydroperoxide resistance regulator